MEETESIPNILYTTTQRGYTFEYDDLNFINVYDSDRNCVKFCKCVCKSKKDFEVEVLYLIAEIESDI